MAIDFIVGPRRSKQRESSGRKAEASVHCTPRVACLLALAHRFEGLIQAGVIQDYSGLARLGHVSRARITQIMNLLELAPSIQESLLGVRTESSFPRVITEKTLRPVLRELRWDRQIERLQQQVRRAGQ